MTRKKPASEKRYLFGYRRLIDLGCFLSLVLILTLPLTFMLWFAADMTFYPLPMLGRTLPPPHSEWPTFLLALPVAIFLAGLAARFVLRLLGKVEMRDLHDYEQDPYVRKVYFAVCALLVAGWIWGPLGLKMVDTSTPQGRLDDAMMNFSNIVFVSGLGFTGIIVLLINLTAWILRTLFGREMIFGVLLERAKDKPRRRTKRGNEGPQPPRL